MFCLKVGSSIPRIGQKHGANHRKGLCRQFLPALAAPACEHVAAVGGAHALAETVNLFPLPNFGLKSHLHSVQYLFLAYLQGNIAICPTHAQRSIFGEKSFARQISEENPIVSQLVIIAAMPPFCQARIRTSEPVFILFLQYIIIFLFVSSCSIPQPVPFGRVCFPPCLNSRFCSAQAAAFCFDNIIFQRFFSLFNPVSICYNLNVRKCAGFFVGLTIGLRETNTKEIYHAC